MAFGVLHEGQLITGNDGKSSVMEIFGLAIAVITKMMSKTPIALKLPAEGNQTKTLQIQGQTAVFRDKWLYEPDFLSI